MVFELQGKKWTNIATYKNHNDLVNCVEFLDEKTCMSSDGQKNEMAIWQIENDGKIKERLSFLE